MADENQDKQLGMDRSIARRDFLNGAAVAVGSSLAGGFLPGLEWIAEGAEQFAQDKPGYYPPTLTGMRGSHDGSFEAAHSERDGSFWKQAGSPIETGETYDLVVAGGGISGLAAAYFCRKQNPNRKSTRLNSSHGYISYAVFCLKKKKAMIHMTDVRNAALN